MATAPAARSNLSATLRMAVSSQANAPRIDCDAELATKRQALANLCRHFGQCVDADAKKAPASKPAELPALPDNLKLSPRMRQTLDRLLAGDSEKQIALQLQLSPHTVHVYVKALYKAFQVSSRGELLSRFVRTPAL